MERDVPSSLPIGRSGSLLLSGSETRSLRAATSSLRQVWNETFKLAIHHSEAQAATLNLIVEVPCEQLL